MVRRVIIPPQLSEHFKQNRKNKYFHPFLIPSKGKLFLLIICIFFFYLAVFNFKNEVKVYDESNENEDAIRQVLAETPYLWRKFTFTNETASSRVEDQQLWIQKISNLPFIQNAKTKRILVETDNMEYFYGTEGKLKCPYAPEFETKCTVEEETWKDRIIGRLKYERVEAVVGARNWIRQYYEPLIPRHVKRFLHILEPPYIAEDANLGRNNALLASYWRGSDIPVPYRRWISNSSYPKELTELEINGFRKKTKMIAAIVSNCKSMNDRLKFINELQKYIQVDVYGKCGNENLTCPKSPGNHECLSKLSTDYKFYLSIENSNCIDYITEKFFENALKYNMLPIVMGAHPDNYKTAAPPHSYIHIQDFKSLKDLAEYLHVLSTDENLYMEYFKWKNTGYITHDQMDDFFCRVCGMLFYADFVPPNSKWNSSTTLWTDVNQCLPEGQWYWK